MAGIRGGDECALLRVLEKVPKAHEKVGPCPRWVKQSQNIFFFILSPYQIIRL
jgi:hypothetical protein